MDGVVGLAFTGMSKINHPTLLQKLSSTYPDLNAVFAFGLVAERQAELHLGGYDLALVGPEPVIAYFPVVKLPSTLSA